MVLKTNDYHLGGQLLIVLFYFTALQVDPTHDEKNTAALYEGLWKILAMLT